MSDLRLPGRERRLHPRFLFARCFSEFPSISLLVLLLCLSLAGCFWKKKQVPIAAPAAAAPPPTASQPAASAPATDTAAPAAPPAQIAAPAAPALPTVPKQGQGALSKILSLVTLAPSPLNIKASIDSAANNNTPVELDVVLIKDKGFWKTAPSMSAKDWFAQKNDLERRYQNKLAINSWEWVPGQQIDPIAIRMPRWLNGAMIFASYPTPGTHSAPIPKGGKIAVSFEADDFTLETSK